MRTPNKAEQGHSWRASCNGSYSVSNNTKSHIRIDWTPVVVVLIVLAPIVYWFITTFGA